ncbi:hypothetical protein ACB092_04G102400 [Castanea dentata]
MPKDEQNKYKNSKTPKFSKPRSKKHEYVKMLEQEEIRETYQGFGVNYILYLDPKFQASVPRTCGDGPNVSYPFWIPQEQEPFFGNPYFTIICNDKIPDIYYSNQSFLVAYAAVYEDACPAPLRNVSLDQTPFNFSLYHHIEFSIFYNCTSMPYYPKYGLDCASNSTHHSFAVFHEEALVLHNFSLESSWYMVVVPVDVCIGVNLTSLLLINYTEVLKMGFPLNWIAHCKRSSGQCGFQNN